jgi:hypothetical protein
MYFELTIHVLTLPREGHNCMIGVKETRSCNNIEGTTRNKYIFFLRRGSRGPNVRVYDYLCLLKEAFLDYRINATSMFCSHDDSPSIYDRISRRLEHFSGHEWSSWLLISP